MFLKERKLKFVDEIVELAEQYMEAHSVSDLHFHLSSENKTDCDKYDFMKITVNSLPSLEGKREVREYREDTVMAVEIQTT